MALSRRSMMAGALSASSLSGSSLAASTPGLEGFPGRLERYRLFPSGHIRPRQVVVWLPADYDSSGRTYPVIYMHDGQNLFDPREAYGSVTWGVAEALSASPFAAIVVGVYNTSLRHREYMPQAIYRGLPDQVMAEFDRATGGPPISDSYIRFLADELRPFIDRTFRTRRAPDQNCLMGSSMGGLISFYGLMERPDRFGRAACLSPHWPILPPGGALALAPTPGDVLKAVSGYLDRLGPNLKGRRLYLDRGDQTLDALYPPYQTPITHMLRARRELKLSYREFPGAAHNEQSWRTRLRAPLEFLLSDPPT